MESLKAESDFNKKQQSGFAKFKYKCTFEIQFLETL